MKKNLKNKAPLRYKLKNGLTVLLESIKTSPVVSVQIGVKVGSVWEKNHEAGLSHVLEHMVFKGTQSYGPGEISQIVEASGGDLNAYTSFDQTVYYITLSSRQIKRGLHIIKEMAFDAHIDPTELEREKEVILEELRRGEDNPYHVLSQSIFSLAYKKHPYGRPIIGYEETIKSFSAKKVKDFYKTWYSPNNMVLGVCGDISIKETKKLVSELFANYKPQKINRPRLLKEPQVKKARKICTQDDVESFYHCITFPVPDATHEDTPALDILSYILGNGGSSRLVQRLKEEENLVSNISSFTYSPKFSGLFGIDSLIPIENAKKDLGKISELIKQCLEEPLLLEEIERAKKNLLSSIYYEKESCQGIARKWMSYETSVDDFRFEEVYLRQLEKTSLEDVQRALYKYICFEKSSQASLYPKKIKIKNPYLELKKSKVKKDWKKIESTQDTQKYLLANGITLILRENHRVPLVSFRCAGLGGLRYETHNNNGISNLIMSVLEKGSHTKSYLETSRIFDDICGHISSFCGRNSWGLSGSFLSEKTREGLELFTDLLINPAFKEDEINKEKAHIIQAIQNQEDSPAQVCIQNFQSKLFKKHPYGLRLLGHQKNIQSFNRNDIVDFYKKMLNPKNLCISVVGDFRSEDILKQLSSSLSKLKIQKTKALRLAPEKKVSKIQKVLTHKNKMQAHLCLGFHGIRLHDKERYAFECMNSVLAGMGGRLFLELRDKQSLAYTVSSLNVEGIEPGFFGIYIGCEPRKINQAIQGILFELEKIQTEAISKNELDRAKNYLIGNHEIELQKNANVASSLCFDALYGFDLKNFSNYSKKIRDVSSQEILKVAKKYLNLKAYTLSVVKAR